MSVSIGLWLHGKAFAHLAVPKLFQHSHEKLRTQSAVLVERFESCRRLLDDRLKGVSVELSA
jgi:hypothetical protein